MLLAGLFAVAVLASAGTAFAAPQALQSDPRLDAVASEIAGFPVTVIGDDDQMEWDALIEQESVTTCRTCPSAAGFAIIAERRVYFDPFTWATLEDIENYGVRVVGYYQSAVGILRFIHEVTHVKLASTDEGRVNACALDAFPSVIQTYFGVPATVTQARTTRVRYRVRVHGRCGTLDGEKLDP